MNHTDNINDIIKELDNGENVFITGSAGSGKTYLAKKYGRSNNRVVTTSTTGMSALNLGGETIHRFLGLGISSRPEQLGKIFSKWDRILKSSKPWDIARAKVMRNLRTLIIDEISMLRRDQFEFLESVISHIKGVPIIFGGVQLILVGDFFQLPPVVTPNDLRKFPDLNKPYCFQSNLWQSAQFKSFNLTSNYRQGEGDFLLALEKIRIGQIDKDVLNLLNSRVGIKLNIPMEPIKLFSRRIDVKKENINCLKQLSGTKYISDAEFKGKEYYIKILSSECPADKELFFCKNAQVMMITNNNKEWVNGTMGIIKETNPLKIRLSSGQTVKVEKNTWNKISFKIDSKGNIKEEVVASMTQYPFKLAYATTIHKSMGLTLDYVDVDLSNCFTSGQAYVALSRCKELNGLTLRGFNKNSFKTNKTIKKFYNVY